jgi:hypothetical protein
MNGWPIESCESSGKRSPRDGDLSWRRGTTAAQREEVHEKSANRAQVRTICYNIAYRGSSTRLMVSCTRQSVCVCVCERTADVGEVFRGRSGECASACTSVVVGVAGVGVDARDVACDIRSSLASVCV